MYPATLIASAFVKKGISEGRPVTQMKLQKMVYFAQGYHLYKHDCPLIIEEFEAWQFGPVVPAIYADFKTFGRDPITFISPLIETELKKILPDAQQTIDYTWDVTKSLSAATLSSWTHKKGSPWEAVYELNSWSTPIDNHVIKGYFKQLFTKVDQRFKETNAFEAPASTERTHATS